MKLFMIMFASFLFAAVRRSAAAASSTPASDQVLSDADADADAFVVIVHHGWSDQLLLIILLLCVW
jgi:hypothetical protein